MFKKLEDFSSFNQVNKSQLKAIRSKLQEDYPFMQKIIDDIIPVKQTLFIVKVRTPESRFEIFGTEGEALFFQ